MKTKGLNASVLRIILIICILLMIGVLCGGFYFAKRTLQDDANAVSQKIADVAASASNFQSIQKIQTELSQQQAIQAKASAITIPSTKYQAQALIDLDTYARLSGVTITDTNFSSVATTDQSTTPPISVLPNGTSSSVTISLQSPLKYTNLLKFVRAIEMNLPKMQISGLTLTGTGSGMVTSDSLTIVVSTT